MTYVPGPQQVPPKPLNAPAGALVVNYSGDQLYNWHQWSGQTCDGRGKITHSNGVLYLSTTGQGTNGVQIISPNLYSSGVFEARVNVPAASDGKVSGWPAFWLSGPNWPRSGEIDIAEGLGGDLTSTYHYNANGPNGSYSPAVLPTVKYPSALNKPGWHTVAAVWDTHSIQIWCGGQKIRTLTSDVIVSLPESIIFTHTKGHTSAPSTMAVSYMRVWKL